MPPGQLVGGSPDKKRQSAADQLKGQPLKYKAYSKDVDPDLLSKVRRIHNLHGLHAHPMHTLLRHDACHRL